MSDLVFLSTCQLASGIRERRFSAVEVLDAHLAQIAKHNPTLNAIVTLDAVGARHHAQAADEALSRGENWGLLHGVPFTIKDYIATAGIRTTSSYPPLAKYIPDQDATVVARLKSAGAILLGKTNLPKLSQGFQTDSPLFGRTNNPWNLAYTSGGSSGGSAAAIAAGLSPLDIGGDIGGSIRIPAHFCGVYGFKPTEYRVSNAGTVVRLVPFKAVRHLRVLGPLARSLEDLQLCLSIIEGPDGQDWQVQSAPPESNQALPLKNYRFAWTNDFGVPVTSETRSTLENLANIIAAQGACVEQGCPAELKITKALRTYGQMIGTELGVFEPAWARSLSPLLELVLSTKAHDPVTQGILQGLRFTFRQYAEALTRQEVFIGQLETFFADWDAWLCPVTCGPAFAHLPLKGNLDSFFKTLTVDNHTLPYNVWGLTHAPLFNLTGHPVVVIPAGRSESGLPIGVQVVGKRWRDRQLLAIAKYLTDLLGGWHSPPGY